MTEAPAGKDNELPYRLITEIQTGEYVHRWGDWLQVRNIDATDPNDIKLTVFDTNPADGGAKEVTWGGYKSTSEILSVKELPKEAE